MRGFPSAAILLLILFLLPSSPQAAEGERLQCDLQSCIVLAIANHPALKAGEASRLSAQAIAAVKKAERNPRLFLEGGAGYLAGESINPFAVVRGVDEEGFRQKNAYGDFYQTVVGLDFTIFEEGTFWGGASKSMQQAWLRVSQTEWREQGLRNQVASEVAEAYFNVLKNRLAIQTHETIVSLFRRDYELAKARFDQEQVSKNDLLLANVRLAAVNRDLFAAQLAWKRSRSELASTLGLDNGKEVEIQDIQETPAPIPSIGELMAQSQDHHPELKAQQLEVKAKQTEVEKIRTERYPRFHLRTHYGFANDFSGNHYDQSLTLLEMTWPIFDFGLIRNKIAAAQAQATEEQAILRKIQMRIAREIREGFFNLQDLEQEIVLLEKQIEQGKEAVQLQRSLLQTGSISESVLHESQAAVFRLELAKRQSEYDQALARFRLALAIGDGKS